MSKPFTFSKQPAQNRDNFRFTPRLLSRFGNVHDAKQIDKGPCSIVLRATCQETEQPVAIKCMPNSKENRSEYRILRSLQHPHIAKFIARYKTPVSIYIVTSFYSRGNLFDIVTRYGSGDVGLPASRSRRYSQQLISALTFLHGQWIVHGDVKLDNLVLDDHDQIRLIDFGFSMKVDPMALYEIRRGTPYFASPEIMMVKPHHPIPSELWSLGVVIWTMYTGCYPYWLPDDLESVTPKSFHIHWIHGPQDPDFQDLVGGLLQFHPRDRLDLESVRNHAWFQGRRLPSGLPPTRAPDELDPDRVKRLRYLGFDRKEISRIILENPTDHLLCSMYHSSILSK